MKKLLSLLGSVVIAASSATAVVSCSYAPSMKDDISRETTFYSEISAEALKEGVLADQGLNIQGQTAGIDTGYSASYFSSQNVIKRFGNLYNSKQGALPKGDTEVSSLFQAVFGTGRGAGTNYTIANSYGDLKNGGVKKGTNLDKIVQANGDAKAIKAEGVNLASPDASVSSAINLVSGIANIVFKNDFSASMGKTLISLLTSGTVKGALSKDSMKDIFTKISGILSSYSAEIKEIAQSVTQSDIAATLSKTDAEDNNYESQLSLATNKLFGGLIYFLTKKAYVYDSAKAGNTTAIQAFWNFLLNKDSSALTPTSTYAGKTNTQFILDSVSGFVSFGITLLHYFREFDKTEYKQQVPTDGTRIFNAKESNGQVIAEVLGSPYLDHDSTDFDKNSGPTNVSSDNFWYYDGTTYSTKLNLQNLISDLDYYLRPVDSKGYQMLRGLTILLGGPLQSGTDTIPQFNPILGSILEPLFPMLADKLSAILKDKLSFLGDNIINPLVNNILAVGEKGVRQIIDWLVTNGDDGFGQTISNLLVPIAKVITMINLNQFANDDTKEIFEIITAIADYIANNNNAAKLFEHPWKQIYSGAILSDVGKIMKKVSSNSDTTVRQIAYGLVGLRDIRNVLTGMTIQDITKNIGYMLGKKDLVLPPFVYKLNTMHVSDLVSYLANNWLANVDNSDPDNQKKNYASAGSNTIDAKEEKYRNDKYSFNTAAMQNIVNSVLPNDEFDPTKFVDPTAAGNILMPYKADDNSDIKILSAVRNGSNVVITLNYPLVDKLNYADVQIDNVPVEKENITGIQEGSSTITISNTDAKSDEAEVTFRDSKGKPFASQPQKVNIESSSAASDIAKKTIVFKYDKTAQATTPVQPLYDSIINYGANNTISSMGTYYVKLAGEKYSDPVHEISSSTPFVIDDKGTTSNVSSEAFENLLGANDTGDTTSFKPGSLLMSISNLYGHWDPNGGGTSNTENAAAAESLMGLLSDVAKLTSDSMTQIQQDVYNKYFDPKNWKILNVKQKNIDTSNGSIQTLNYDLQFYNPDLGKTFTYQVGMSRNPADNNTSTSTDDTSGWIVNKLYRQD